MRSFDPIESFYSLVDGLLGLVRRLVAPIGRLLRFLGALVMGPVDWLLDRMGSSKRDHDAASTGRVYAFFLDVVSLPKELLDSRLSKKTQDSSIFQAIGNFFLMLLNLSLMEPAKWMASLAGLGFAWVATRTWGFILVSAIPSLILISATVLVWRGGRMDKAKLAQHYFELGLAETSTWDDTDTRDAPVAAPGDSGSDRLADPDASPALSSNEASPSISSYAEMLFRRVQILQPRRHGQFVIGMALVQRGAVASGQKTLTKIAPNDAIGYPPAHSVLAASYLNQYISTRDPELLTLFEHHSKVAVQVPQTSREVLLAASELQWERGSRAEALRILELAAERYPELYVRLIQRAASSGQQRLANDARKKAMIHLQESLASNPYNDQARVQIAQLHTIDAAGLAAAEAVLNEGLSLAPSRLLSRALSEVYRLRFVTQMIQSRESQVDINLLDIALQIDPTNPLVTDQIEQLVKLGHRPDSELRQLLNKILASGTATTGTHAILAEMHLNQNDPTAALLHLEQVYQAAPNAIKYTNQLAKLYMAAGRHDDALGRATYALQYLEEADLLRERYGCDLLETVGDIQLARGEAENALGAYQRCLQIDAGRNEIRRKLADLHRQLGNAAQADALEEELSAVEAAANKQPLDDNPRQTVFSSASLKPADTSAEVAPERPIPSSENTIPNGDHESSSLKPDQDDSAAGPADSNEHRRQETGRWLIVSPSAVG